MKYAAIFLLAAALGLSGCVGDDQYAVLDQRLYRLEQQQREMAKRFDELQRQSSQIDTEQQKIDTDVQTLRTQLAESRVRNDSLRTELRDMTGRIEETEYALRNKDATVTASEAALGTRLGRLDESVKQHDARIGQLEGYLNLEQAAAPPPDIPEKPEAEPTEDDLYNHAKGAFDTGALKTARNGFFEYLKRFPKSKRADNAQFWIAEIYYREKWFEKAILEYQKVIESYPKGNKVPAAMLKQGMAFSNLGDRSNARLILRELVSKHPNTNEAKIAQKKLKGL